MKKLIVSILIFFFISCYHNKKEKVYNKDQSSNNILDSEIPSKPTTCRLPENPTIEKLNFLWENTTKNNNEVEYYFFDSDNLKTCLLDSVLKNRISSNIFEFSLNDSNIIVLHKYLTEYIEAYITESYSLSLNNKTKNTLDTFIKVEPDSKKFQEVKSICNF